MNLALSEERTKQQTTQRTKRRLVCSVAIFAFASGCTVVQHTPIAHQHTEVRPLPAARLYIDPPIYQPAPVYVAWAPPPLLIETVTAPPFYGAVWVGGYWVWDGDWVWAAGHWKAPPRANYYWVHPYYEYRNSGVIFIAGHWSPPDVFFVPPPIGLVMRLIEPTRATSQRSRPVGPQGVFIPPPPGSQMGLIVPAPIGTAPIVLSSMAPVVGVGMRIHRHDSGHQLNVTNITNVTVIAPPGAMANGRGFESVVPAPNYQYYRAQRANDIQRTNTPAPVQIAPPVMQPVPNSAPNPAMVPIAPPVMAPVPMQQPNMQRPSSGVQRPPYTSPPSPRVDSRAPRVEPERQPRPEQRRFNKGPNSIPQDQNPGRFSK
jgi:hypothetical protein